MREGNRNMGQPVIIKNPQDSSTLAIIIRENYSSEGIEFFTPDEYSQQLAYMNHPKGHVIMPHTHNHVERQVKYTQEVLLIKKGVLRVDFYDDAKQYIESIVLREGDIILLASGGHGFEVLENVEMYEIKQGPYIGEGDKIRFDTKIMEHVYADESN